MSPELIVLATIGVTTRAAVIDYGVWHARELMFGLPTQATRK